jgi:hypothetical protein
MINRERFLNFFPNFHYLAAAELKAILQLLTNFLSSWVFVFTFLVTGNFNRVGEQG